MTKAPIRVLFLEDNPGDARLVREALASAGGDFVLDWTDRLADALDRLEDRDRHFEVVLADLGLPDSYGIETLNQLRRSAHDVPIVVLTGTFEESVGVSAVAIGAQDYLIKDELSARTLVRALRYAIERHANQKAIAEANRELMTSRDDLEHRVKERTADVMRTNKDLEIMLHVATHDLREPLNSISAFSRMILEKRGEAFDEWTTERLTRIDKAAVRMSKLLDSLLAMAHARRIDPIDEATESRNAILDVLERYEARIRDLGARVMIAESFPKLNVARTWLVEVVSNLVSNALKFHLPEVPPDVEIAPYEADDASGIVVRDRGPGIPEELRERMFQLFQRGVGREIEGTGAGLAIVRQIAQNHGGRAWMREREGGGSEFIVTFRPSGSSIGKLRVLLVDDDEDFIFMMRDMLAAAPSVGEVEVAMDGIEALSRLNKAKALNGRAVPDIVLLDLNMPRKNGFELLAEMKADTVLAKIPTVVLTASVRTEDEKRALAGGAEAFLSKPLRRDRLFQLIEEVARKK